MSVEDPHEAERELRDEPKPAAREEPRVSTIVGDPQHPAEIAPERDRDE